MEIIAHRGFWLSEEEKNSMTSLKRAIDSDYGIETDVRDYMGKLVISHNIADDSSPSFEEFLEYYQRKNSSVCLAINIKADGLQDHLISLFEKYSVYNYFLFDMSIPEMVVNYKKNLRFYTRKSDVENEMVMYEFAKGVWLDNFYGNTGLDLDTIQQSIRDEKGISLVSPELHGREHVKVWNEILNSQIDFDYFALCTDKPKEAEQFFHGR